MKCELSVCWCFCFSTRSRSRKQWCFIYSSRQAVRHEKMICWHWEANSTLKKTKNLQTNTLLFWCITTRFVSDLRVNLHLWNWNVSLGVELTFSCWGVWGWNWRTLHSLMSRKTLSNPLILKCLLPLTSALNFGGVTFFNIKNEALSKDGKWQSVIVLPSFDVVF